MLKLSLKILSQVKSQPNQGFTILEAVAAMLIALGFVLASLQAIVLATAFRVKVQEKQLATQLIQEEIDNIQSVANSLNQDSSDSTRYNPVLSRCTATQYSDGYAKALWDSYSALDYFKDVESSNPDKLQIKTIAGNNRIGLERIDQSASSTPPHKTLKIRYQVRNYDGDKTRPLLPPDNKPDQSVFDLSKEIIATDYIEITPNAALQCP